MIPVTIVPECVICAHLNFSGFNLATAFEVSHFNFHANVGIHACTMGLLTSHLVPIHVLT